MLHFLTSIIIFAIAFCIVAIIKMAIQIKEFLLRTKSVINLYKWLMKEVLETNFELMEVFVIRYYKYQLIFSNREEATREFLKIIEDVWRYYGKMTWIPDIEDVFANEIRQIKEIQKEIMEKR